MRSDIACFAAVLTMYVGLTYTAPKADAAPKTGAAPKAETKSTAADIAVSQRLEEVLRHERTTEQPDRAAVLQELREAYPTHAAVRWASGQVSSAGLWRDYSEEPALTAANDRLTEYRALRTASQLTPERHRELATWCRQQGLLDQERAHLWQTLIAQPAQPDVWRKLGYQWVNGQWLTADAIAAVEQAQRTYQQNLQRWQKQAQFLSQRFESPQSGVRDKAREALHAIDDDAAIPALELALAYTSADQGCEFVAWVKQRPSLPATFALARLSILSPWNDVREMAINSLRPRRWEHFIPSLLGLLSDDETAEIQVYRTPIDRVGAPILTFVFRRELSNCLEIQRRTLRVGTPNPKSSIVVPAGILAGSPSIESTRLLARQRAANDNEQVLKQLFADLDKTQVTLGDADARVESALSAITGETSLQGGKAWWTWWASLTNVDPQSTDQKQVVEVAETSTFHPSMAVVTFIPSCLPAGSLVYTELGHRPIETIQAGDRVLAKDVETGELAYQAVLHTTVRRPQSLVKLFTSSETIEATQGHFFWVSGKGWRMAREIQPGDRLHGVQGTVRITDVSTGDMADVYNLVVDRTSTYFVGQSLVLSHDVTFPVPTDTKVPGLAAR